MIFPELDEGEILRRETGLDRPKIVRLLIGNPLIRQNMVKHVPDAGSYAPVTVLVDERSDGVHVAPERRACRRSRPRCENREPSSQLHPQTKLGSPSVPCALPHGAAKCRKEREEDDNDRAVS
jgi:hypothetical protein